MRQAEIVCSEPGINRNVLAEIASFFIRQARVDRYGAQTVSPSRKKFEKIVDGIFVPDGYPGASGQSHGGESGNARSYLGMNVIKRPVALASDAIQRGAFWQKGQQRRRFNIHVKKTAGLILCG